MGREAAADSFWIMGSASGWKLIIKNSNGREHTEALPGDSEEEWVLGAEETRDGRFWGCFFG